MGGEARALDLVRSHCDIAVRLAAVPPSASVRGIFFRNLETQVERAGKLEEYRAYFPDERRSLLPYYPLADYLLRLACAGAVLESPDRVHEGMFRIARSYSTTFAESLLGRTMIRLLSRDPVRLSEQGIAAKRQTHNYGHWEMVRHGPNAIEMRYDDEYQWIESVMAGAAQGTFEACGIDAKLETVMRGPYSGSTFVRF
jgi:uncharacterized protein (TIGR02265 family)